jgi:hypothetical protein
MSRIDSLTQIRVRLTHVTTEVSPTSLERIRQAWAGVPMKVYRDVMEKLGNAQRDSEEPFQKARYEPNLAVVYKGLPEIQCCSSQCETSSVLVAN